MAVSLPSSSNFSSILQSIGNFDTSRDCLHAECHSVVEIITMSKMIIMQVDTGAGRSVNYANWKALGKPASDRCAKGPVACDGHELKRLGMITIDMEFNEKHMFWNRNYIGFVRN